VFSNTALYTVALPSAGRFNPAPDSPDRRRSGPRSSEAHRRGEQARAIADERLHIAQELHDVVAHSMSVIAVQAGVGMHVADTDAAEAKKALENISNTSRSSLAELRRLLGVLRDDGDGANYAPAPGLGDLDKMAKEVSDEGVPVTVTMEGSLADVPPGVDFTGYRIVQEALTNVLKHAGPSTARVLVAHEPGALRIEVRDDGRGVNCRSSGTGHGLMGMRERVAVYGGRLDAGPVDGGGFKVAAELPYAEASGTR
jgi:signal transduction histidine kinase